MGKKIIMVMGLVLSSLASSLAVKGQAFFVSSTKSQAFFAPSTKSQAFFVPFPKASDNYWRRDVPTKMRQDYIRLGDSCLAKPWNAIPDSVFAEFRTNGNRTRYEAASFGIRNQFACLVMAEIMEYQGRFLPAIRKGLRYFLDKEPWWGIPAHYPKAKPSHEVQPVDLFNAETSSMLAWTIYMLGNEIDGDENGSLPSDEKVKPLTEQVRDGIEYRFLNPTLYQPQGWKHNANNWNTWITSNWLETALICERDNSKLQSALDGIHADLRLFLKGYPDDGACEEGVAYWDRAGASFFESLYFLDKAEKNQSRFSLNLNNQEQEKVHRMGQFITTMHIHDLHFVNYSDAAAFCIPNINILFPFGAYEKDEKMMQLAAYVGKKYDYLSKPSTLFLQSGNYPTLGRELMLLSMLPAFQKTAPVPPRTVDAYMENSQIMVASTAAKPKASDSSRSSAKHSWLVSAKGGNNAESHNHNDIGNFIVYHDNEPVIIDLGRDTYTSLTFSSHRFELMNNRSAYHNVPIINGFEQKDGKEYRAYDAQHTSNKKYSEFSLSIAKAYPAEAQVKRWNRRVMLDRRQNSVMIEDDFGFNAVDTTELILMCYGEPKRDPKGRILLADGKVWLDIPKGFFEVDWEKVEMKDGIMKTQWNDNVYRLHIRFDKQAYDGMLRYWFRSAK